MKLETPTFSSLFSGGGIADIGAKAAGFTLASANEIDPKIAEVYIRNHGNHMRVGDILNQHPDDYPDSDLWHASPVCTNASLANSGGEESTLDIATANKTAEFIRSKKMKFFTMENVIGYKKFKSFKIIMDALSDLGYMYDAANLNSADFGVPQTRRRLIVRAVRGGFVPPLPPAVPWVGWYDAVEDIIETFPESKFAPWQLERLPEDIASHFLMAGGGNTNLKDAAPGNGVRGAAYPSHVVTTKKNGGAFPKAFIVGQQKFNDILQIKSASVPADTVTSNNNQRYLRAFIVNGSNASNEKITKNEDGPVFTIIANTPRSPVRAFIVSGVNASYNSAVTVRAGSPSALTVTAGDPKHPSRAWLQSGRVVMITPRGLARFQSIPDSYALPEDNPRLACEIIGNGVPSKMYEVIAKAFLSYYA